MPKFFCNAWQGQSIFPVGRPCIEALLPQISIAALFFLLPADTVLIGLKNSRTGTQICSPGPSIQLWCPFGKGWLWILQNSRRKILLVGMFKIFNGLSPEYLSDTFEKSDNTYCMRDKNKLIQPLKRTTAYGLKSFGYYSSHVWNMLPVHFKSCESISEFKNRIKHWSTPTCSCSMCAALLWFDVYRASSFMHKHMFYCLCEMAMLECCI